MFGSTRGHWHRVELSKYALILSREVACHVPEAPRGSKAGAVQINDVFVDERGIVYAVDRFTGGLYTLEMSI